MLRTCDDDVPTFVSHSVNLPRCCPVSGNPAPGSTLSVSYIPKGVVLPVEELAAWVEEYVGGHPSGRREMEAMIQHLAKRVAEIVNVRVKVVADLNIAPPFGGDQQKMKVRVRAIPAQPRT